MTADGKRSRPESSSLGAIPLFRFIPAASVIYNRTITSRLVADMTRIGPSSSDQRLFESNYYELGSARSFASFNCHKRTRSNGWLGQWERETGGRAACQSGRPPRV